MILTVRKENNKITYDLQSLNNGAEVEYKRDKKKNHEKGKIGTEKNYLPFFFLPFALR